MSKTGSEIVLLAENVSKAFGKFVALDGVNMALRKGERRALIGPNGAGKSTFINVVGGQLAGGRRDRILFENHDISGKQPHKIAALGVGRTFQISRTYRQLSVFENMLAALVVARKLTNSLSVRHLYGLKDEAREMLATVGVAQLADHVVDDISHGDRKRLEFGMVLAGRPRLLLLDEPTAGMALQERHDLMDMVARHVDDAGLTLLFVEHDIDIVFRIAEAITVMARGRVFFEGTPEEVAENAGVQDIYLGTAR